jgi:hypothetical protein
MVNDQDSAPADKHLFCIDSFGIGKDSGVVVYVYNDRDSVKSYCRQTGMEIREGLKRMDVSNEFTRC